MVRILPVILHLVVGAHGVERRRHYITMWCNDVSSSLWRLLLSMSMVAKFLDCNKAWSCKYDRKKQKNWHQWLSCAWLPSETNCKLLLFFHRSTMQMVVSVKKDYWYPESLQCGQHDVKFLLSVTSDNIGRFQKISILYHGRLLGFPKGRGGSRLWNSEGMGGYLRFEIQRHGGIPQVGFLE